jgi:hypothetical protein
MYLTRSGRTRRHLSLGDRETFCLGPDGELPSSSPTRSSSAVARGVYGTFEGMADGGSSSYAPDEAMKAEVGGRRK